MTVSILKPVLTKKGRWLNTILLLLLVSSFGTCKKGSDAPPPNNNEVKATILLPSGNTININATATKASMGCLISLGGGYTHIDATNSANAAVYMSIYVPATTLCNNPGTYNFNCEYRVDFSSGSTPIYSNLLATNRGSITFTTINDHYMEGTFNAICRCASPGCGTDSVAVSGTFKGDYLR
jgi:hypothetical protein